MSTVTVDHEHDLVDAEHPEWRGAVRCTSCPAAFLPTSNGGLLPMHLGKPTRRAL